MACGRAAPASGAAMPCQVVWRALAIREPAQRLGRIAPGGLFGPPSDHARAGAPATEPFLQRSLQRSRVTFPTPCSKVVRRHVPGAGAGPVAVGNCRALAPPGGAPAPDTGRRCRHGCLCGGGMRGPRESCCGTLLAPSHLAGAAVRGRRRQRRGARGGAQAAGGERWEVVRFQEVRCQEGVSRQKPGPAGRIPTKFKVGGERASYTSLARSSSGTHAGRGRGAPHRALAARLGATHACTGALGSAPCVKSVGLGGQDMDDVVCRGACVLDKGALMWPPPPPPTPPPTPSKPKQEIKEVRHEARGARHEARGGGRGLHRCCARQWSCGKIGAGREGGGMRRATPRGIARRVARWRRGRGQAAVPQHLALSCRRSLDGPLQNKALPRL